MRTVWPGLSDWTPQRLLSQSADVQIFEVRLGGKKKAVKIIDLAGYPILSDLDDARLSCGREVHHPHLLKIDLLENRRDVLLLVFDLAKGNLRNECRAARLAGAQGIERRRLLEVFSQVAAALDFLHQHRRQIHGGLKPENILEFGDGWRVAELGLLHHPRLGLKRTPWYGAPESFRGNFTTAGDQFSLAVCYMEMLTGRLPFRTDRPEAAANLNALPEQDREVVGRALAADPARRFASCGDFVQALCGEHADSPSTSDSIAVAPRCVTAPADGAAPVQFGASKLAPVAPTPLTVWLAEGAPAETIAAIEDFAKRRRFHALQLTAKSIALSAPSSSGFGRSPVVVNREMLLTLQFFSRQDGGRGCFMTAAPAGGENAKDVSAAGAYLLLDELVRALGLKPAVGHPLRNEQRTRLRKVLELSSQSGVFRRLKLRVETMDASPHGIGMASLLPLPAGPAQISAPGAIKLIRVRLVRCRPLGVGGFLIGAAVDEEAESLETLIAGL